MKFVDFKPRLAEDILNEVMKLGFVHMTPVQAATLPHFLSHKDVCVDACTGSGKTLAFVLPIVQILKDKLEQGTLSAPKTSNTKLVSMIISPTRELTKQIYDCALQFMLHVLPSVKVLLCIGGTSVSQDLKWIHNASGHCSILFGTPGRTEDLLNQCVGKSIDCRDFEILILDEADTLLDMGFEASLNKILDQLPKQRRTGLFSATQTQEVKALARAGLRNPVTISVQVKAEQTQIIPSTLKNYFALVEYDKRLSVLLHFIRSKLNEKFLVFFSTCNAVDFFGRVLEILLNGNEKKVHDNLPVLLLHGKMPQKKRTTNYERFVAQKFGVLVCTDVVARGIDLPDVHWIVQFDPPQDPNFFVHRVGRTARAGRHGAALSFLSSNEDTYVNFLRLRKVPLEEMIIPFDAVNDVLPLAKKISINDRAMLEMGTNAFIAFLRSYKEHQCQFIFQFKELDLAAVARGFALLQLPKINELRNKKIDFVKTDIKITDIKFVDKAREKLRQVKLKEIERQRIAHAEKYEKRSISLECDKESEKNHPRRREKKKGLHQQLLEEWDELAHEEMLFKKLKKGKISKEEYDAVLTQSHLPIDESEKDDSDCEQQTKTKKRKYQSAAEAKRNERFKKVNTGATRKSAEQKKEAMKRDLRIRQRKKVMGLKKQQQRVEYRIRHK